MSTTRWTYSHVASRMAVLCSDGSRMFLEGGCNIAGIDGKVIAITGGISGIGRAAAPLLARRGAMVVLGARRIDELEAVVRDIESVGGIASHRRTDVTKREDVAALTALASDRHGKLDALMDRNWAPTSAAAFMRW